MGRFFQLSICDQLDRSTCFLINSHYSALVLSMPPSNAHSSPDSQLLGGCFATERYLGKKGHTLECLNHSITYRACCTENSGPGMKEVESQYTEISYSNKPHVPFFVVLTPNHRKLLSTELTGMSIASRQTMPVHIPIRLSIFMSAMGWPPG
jgi:hypothetical protein